jgi:hypothetical protein
VRPHSNANGTLQLARGGVWISGRKRRKALKAAGVTGTRLRNQIVDALGYFDGWAGLQIVKPRRGQGKHLHVDALVVHRGDPLLADVAEAPGQRVVAAAVDLAPADQPAPGVDQLGDDEVLLQTHDAHAPHAPPPPLEALPGAPPPAADAPDATALPVDPPPTLSGCTASTAGRRLACDRRADPAAPPP